MFPAMTGTAREIIAIIGAIFAIAVLAVALPPCWNAVRELRVEDDPAALANLRLAPIASGAALNREVETALAADDVDLARSFADLARDRGVGLDSSLAAKVEAEESQVARIARNARHFARGFVKGEPDDAASLAGAAASDLLIIGDVRDAAHEGAKLYHGEAADKLVLGLAGVGIAMTAGTYATWGAAAPARAAVTLAKAARKTGRMSAPLGAAMMRAVDRTVDVAALERAATLVSLRDPVVAVRAARDAIKIDRAVELRRMIADAGTIQARAGTAATLDGMRIAQGGRGLSRLAKLAEKEGSKTRAILKLLGGAAIAAVALTFETASWLMTAIFALFGFCCAVKSLAERASRRYLRWRKLQRSQTLALA